MEEETHSTNTFYEDDRGGRFGLRHLGLLYYYRPPSRRVGGDKIAIPWRDVHAVRQLPQPKETTTATTNKRGKRSLTLTISTKDGNTVNFHMKDEDDLDLIHKDICSRVRRANKRSVFRRTQHEMMMTATTATTSSDTAGFGGASTTTAFTSPTTTIIRGMVPVRARSSQADLIASSINAIESETPPHHHHRMMCTAYPERDSVTPDDLDRNASASNSSLLQQDSTAPDDVVS